MNSSEEKNPAEEFEPLAHLIEAMEEDPQIAKKVIYMLQLSAWQRRSVLNNWLELLRVRNAPENLIMALTALFDDKTAEDLLTLFKSPKNNDSMFIE